MRDGTSDGPLRDDYIRGAMAGPGRADARAAGGVRGAGAEECSVRLNSKLFKKEILRSLELPEVRQAILNPLRRRIFGA